MRVDTDKRKRADQEIDDLLKVLSIAAYCSNEIIGRYPDSVVYAAIVLLIIAIGSKGFFVFLNFLVTCFLSWIAIISGDSLIIGASILYLVMTVVLYIEYETPQGASKYAFVAIWWLGQLVINAADLYFNHSPGPFSYVFFIAAIVMSLRGFGLALKLRYFHNENTNDVDE